MQWWYWLLGFLPFEWAKPGEMIFMKNALLAVILISPVFGILGTMIVNNRMAFFSDALGHGAFTGIAIGGILGFFEPQWSAILFAMLFSFGITYIKYKSRMSSDTVIGVFSSMSIALGIFLATSGGKSFTKLNTYLIGDILSITPSEIGMIFVVLVTVIMVWVTVFNRLLVVSISRLLADSRGFKTIWIETVFTTLIAIVVTLSMSWIGLLVINSFLVLPAAAARNISRNVRQYHLLTVMISLISGIAGLLLSYYFETASGATIVLLSAVFFFSTLAFRSKFE